MPTSQSKPRNLGVKYTEGPESPNVDESTYTYTPPQRTATTHRVPFRVWRLEEDGNDYLASTKEVTR